MEIDWSTYSLREGIIHENHFRFYKLVKSINPDKIFLNTDNNLTQYSKDATMDNEKKVANMAKKTIDRDLK